jgi:hypothetical protein
VAGRPSGLRTRTASGQVPHWGSAVLNALTPKRRASCLLWPRSGCPFRDGVSIAMLSAKWVCGVPHHAPLKRTPKGKYPACTVNGCAAAHYARGLCSRHYKRQWVSIPLEGSPNFAEANGKPKSTADKVREIRILRLQGWSYVRLGRRFGLSDNAIRERRTCESMCKLRSERG